LAKDETNWKVHIDAYFEACRTTEEDDENNSNPNSDCENDRDDDDETLTDMN
jgi:hypothetical protein